MTFLELLIRFDQHLFQLLYTGLRPDNSWQRTQVDHFFLMANMGGEFFIVVPVLIGLWWASRTQRIFFVRFVLLALGIALAAGVNGAVKQTFDRSRPATAFVEPARPVEGDALPYWRYHRVRDGAHPEWFTEFLAVRVDVADVHRPLLQARSFSSGHAQFAFTLATALAAWFAFLRVPLFGWAVLTALARIYAGHHFPYDVVAGAFIGWAGMLVVLGGAGWLVERQRQRHRAGPLPGWAAWLAEGLPPRPPAEQAARRWARSVALWLAIALYPLLIVLLVAVQQPGPFVFGASIPAAVGPLAVLVYVAGWRLLLRWRGGSGAVGDRRHASTPAAGRAASSDE